MAEVAKILRNLTQSEEFVMHDDQNCIDKILGYYAVVKLRRQRRKAKILFLMKLNRNIL